MPRSFRRNCLPPAALPALPALLGCRRFPPHRCKCRHPPFCQVRKTLFQTPQLPLDANLLSRCCIPRSLNLSPFSAGNLNGHKPSPACSRNNAERWRRQSQSFPRQTRWRFRHYREKSAGPPGIPRQRVQSGRRPWNKWRQEPHRAVNPVPR